MGFLGHMVVLSPNFLRNLILSSVVTVSTYSPSNNARGFLFSHPLQHLLFVDFKSTNSHSDQCEVVSHISSDLHFFGDVEYLFRVFVGHLHVFFGEMSVSSLLSIF